MIGRAPLLQSASAPCAFVARSSSLGLCIRFAHAANAGVGPRHRSSSTSRNSGAFVRSVASRLNSRASSRWLLIASAGQTPTENPQLIESRELNSKVIKLYGERKYDEALPLAKRALQLRETALGSTHPDLIPLLINLGELHKARHKLDDAATSFERALSVGEKNFGIEDLRLAKILDELAYIKF